MSLRIEPVPARGETRLRTQGPTLIVPLRTAAVDLVLAGAESQLVDAAHWALAPTRRALMLRALNGSAHVVLATVEAPLVSQVANTYGAAGLDMQTLDQQLARTACLPRTVWVHELVHRYVFERQVCHSHTSEAARFLECELVKEWCFLAIEHRRGDARASRAQEQGAVVGRAIAHIETNVLKPANVEALARACGASESTLLRAFRRELDSTPAEYWRQRRLDEALALLESGRFGVAEVAVRVGYQSPTAFSEAFSRQFGVPPSRVRPVTLAT